jgi:hypothetical protein
MDTGGPVLDGTTLWYSATKRDGTFATHLVGVDTRTGATRSTAADPFFRFGAAVGNHAWGVDNDGVVEFDLNAGSISRRWSSFSLPNGSGSSKAVPAYVASDGKTLDVVTTSGRHAGVSAVDLSTGSIRWTTEFPEDGPGGYSGGQHLGVAIGPDGVYVALTDADYRAGIHVWRLSTNGALLADQPLTVPLIINESPGLAVSSDGVFVTAFDSTATQHGHLFALDPLSLKQRAVTTAQVLEGVYVGQGAVWTIGLPCNTFLLTRYDPRTLHRQASYVLSSMSYEIDATSQTLWDFVTKSPAEAVRLEGLKL